MQSGIGLTDFVFEASLGVLDREQRATQPLSVDVFMAFDPTPAAGGDLARSVNYAGVQTQIQTIAQCGRWRLIESIAVAIANLLLAPPGPAEGRAQVDEVRVTLRKPTILDGAVPYVCLARRAVDAAREARTPAPGVTVEVLVEADVQGAYRVHLAPGAAWTPPLGLSIEVIAGAVTAGGAPLGPGDRLAWGTGVTLRGAGEVAATVLAVGTGRA
jgi:dihydroneopterin aldolase